jgi:hypothetical protein
MELPPTFYSALVFFLQKGQPPAKYFGNVAHDFGSNSHVSLDQT